MDLYGLIWFIDEAILPDEQEFLARYLHRPECYPELSELVRPYCFRTLRAQVQGYAKVPRRMLLTYEYVPSSQERKLYDLLYSYINQPVKLAFPEMDSYDLALRLLGLQGSSAAAAILQTIRGVIKRLGRGAESGDFHRERRDAEYAFPAAERQVQDLAVPRRLGSLRHPGIQARR